MKVHAPETSGAATPSLDEQAVPVSLPDLAADLTRDLTRDLAPDLALDLAPDLAIAVAPAGATALAHDPWSGGHPGPHLRTCYWDHLACRWSCG